MCVCVSVLSNKFFRQLSFSCRLVTLKRVSNCLTTNLYHNSITQDWLRSVSTNTNLKNLCHNLYKQDRWRSVSMTTNLRNLYHNFIAQDSWRSVSMTTNLRNMCHYSFTQGWLRSFSMNTSLRNLCHNSYFSKSNILYTEATGKYHKISWNAPWLSDAPFVSKWWIDGLSIQMAIYFIWPVVI